MKNLGIVALIGGWLVITVWGVFRGVLESQSLIFSISLSVIWIGFLVLLISAILQRYKESKDDPYKDVEV
mgnify:CR=1 FL=1|tara:strand:+ start:318 stop:527 length:210 start_codon:yes stop_codon:yes gene_type:complete